MKIDTIQLRLPILYEQELESKLREITFLYKSKCADQAQQYFTLAINITLLNLHRSLFLTILNS